MSKKEFKILKDLVKQNTGNEIKCRDALMPFSKHLIGNSDLAFEKTEWSNDRGRTDMILIVEPIGTQFGSKLISTDRIALVFELKAPNKKVFQYHSSKRFIPSRDLSIAESQLFDYTQRSSLDLLYFTQKFNATEVRPGGIIIGRENTMFQITNNQSKKFSTAHELEDIMSSTLKARKKYLYDPSSISVYTWDHILQLIETRI